MAGTAIPARFASTWSSVGVQGFGVSVSFAGLRIAERYATRQSLTLTFLQPYNLKSSHSHRNPTSRHETGEKPTLSAKRCRSHPCPSSACLAMEECIETADLQTKLKLSQGLRLGAGADS
eukprot:3199759-Rhodomonas_salina.1